MSDFKAVIILLCKVLHNLTNVNLKPEYFRLAKFNISNLECTEAFWQVLHNLCCLAIHNSEECTEDRTLCIIKNVSRLGYKYSHRISASISGHQLLLILGWLLWNDILRININYHIYKSHMYLEFSDQGTHGYKNKVKPGVQCDSEMHYLLHLAGKIRLNMKAMGNYLEDRAQLCNKIHEASLGFSSLPHLSVLDIKIIKDSSLVSEFTSKLEHCTQVLETYAKWKKKSYIFWEWMVSVLGETKKHTCKTSNTEENEEELLKIYLKILKEEVKKNVLTENKEKNMNTKSLRTMCKRMVISSEDSQINKNIADVDLDILKLEKECKEKERELHENLAKLLKSKSDVTILKSKK